MRLLHLPVKRPCLVLGVKDIGFERAIAEDVPIRRDRDACFCGGQIIRVIPGGQPTMIVIGLAIGPETYPVGFRRGRLDPVDSFDLFAAGGVTPEDTDSFGTYERLPHAYLERVAVAGESRLLSVNLTRFYIQVRAAVERDCGQAIAQ